MKKNHQRKAAIREAALTARVGPEPAGRRPWRQRTAGAARARTALATAAARSLLAAATAAALTLGGDAMAAGFKVVVHPSVPVASLSRAGISSAFLKKTDKWPDGTPLVPVEQPHDSPLRQLFCREVHGRGIAMIDAYWQKEVFSGRATPPLTKANDAEVIAYVRSVRGAIGYVSAAAETADLKEIRIE